MRIVKLDAKTYELEEVWGGGTYYYSPDTIEISDAQLDEIYQTYKDYHFHLWTFSQYLRELISLAGEGK